jgi:hypothetical protein
MSNLRVSGFPGDAIISIFLENAKKIHFRAVFKENEVWIFGIHAM